jgi:hypothetical protein
MSQQGINGLNIPTIQNKQISFRQNALPQAGLNNTSMQGNTPLQGIDTDKVMQSVDNSYYANRVKASEDEDTLKVWGLTLPIWLGIAKFMDYFNPKCAGEYKDSLPGKFSGLGDNFAQKTPVGKALNNFMRWVNVKTYNLSKKSQFIYALRNHATSPEWSFAKTPGAGVLGFLSADAQTVTEEFLKPIADKENKLGFIPLGKNYNAFQKLENYGLSQTNINSFAESLKGQTHAEQAIALQVKELELLGVDPKIIARAKTAGGLKKLEAIAKCQKLRLLGFKNVKDFSKYNGKFLENQDRIFHMFDKMAKEHPTWKVSIWRSNGGAFTKAKNWLFGRTVSFSEYRNKYLATTGKGSKTVFGKILGKAMAWGAEGWTNRWAGGKLAVLMQAYLFGDMALHAIKAPKNEKFKTLAERFVNDFSLFIGMSIGIMAMHKFGGFKFAGLDKKGVKVYEQALKDFNAKVKAGAFTDKASYKAAKKLLKEKLGTKNIKNPIVKILQKMALLVNAGNQRVASYHSTSKMNMNWFRFLKNSNIIGVPLRIWIAMGLISPFIAKTATKLTHKIFGRPTNSVLDEDKEAKEDEQSKNAQEMVKPQNDSNLIRQATTQNKTTSTENTYKSPNEYQSDTNLIKKTTQQENSTQAFKGNEPIQQNPNNYQSDTNLIKKAINGEQSQVRTYVPSPECTIQAAPNDVKKEIEPTRTYIPSPQGMVPKDPDTTAADKAFAQADMAEKYVNETLASINRG